MNTRKRNTAIALSALILGASSLSAHADPVADFYKGKSITMGVGTTPMRVS